MAFQKNHFSQEIEEISVRGKTQTKSSPEKVVEQYLKCLLSTFSKSHSRLESGNHHNYDICHGSEYWQMIVLIMTQLHYNDC